MIFIDENTANDIFDILIAECDASEQFRYDFIRTQCEGCEEYRIGGKLGFGGKFWNSHNSLYITCYPEDENKDRERLIKKVNEILKKFYYCPRCNSSHVLCSPDNTRHCQSCHYNFPTHCDL